MDERVAAVKQVLDFSEGKLDPALLAEVSLWENFFNDFPKYKNRNNEIIFINIFHEVFG